MYHGTAKGSVEILRTLALDFDVIFYFCRCTKMADWGIASITTSLFGDEEPPPSIPSPIKSSSPRPVRGKKSSKSPMRCDGNRPTRLDSLKQTDPSSNRNNSTSRSPPRQYKHSSSLNETLASLSNSVSARQGSRSLNLTASNLSNRNGSSRSPPPRTIRHSSSMQNETSNVSSPSSINRVGSRSPVRQFKHSSSLGQQDTKKPMNNRSSRSPVRETSSNRTTHQRTSRSPNRPRADSDGNGRHSKGNRPRADSDNVDIKSKPSMMKNMMGNMTISTTGSSLMARRGIRSPISPLKTDSNHLTPPTKKEMRHRSESPTPTPKQINLDGNGSGGGWTGSGQSRTRIQIMRNHSDEPMSPGINVSNGETIVSSTTEKLRKMVGLRKVAISPRAGGLGGLYSGFGRKVNKNNDGESSNTGRQRVHSHELVTRTNQARPREAMIISPPIKGGRQGGVGGEGVDGEIELSKGEMTTPHAPTAEVISKGLSEWIVSNRPEIEPIHLIAEDMLDERHSSRQVKLSLIHI